LTPGKIGLRIASAQFTSSRKKTRGVMHIMRFLLASLIGLVMLGCLITVARSQNPAENQNPADVKVIKFSWSKERVGWERDPFSGPIENFDEMRVRTRNEKRILDAKRSGSSVEANKAEREALTDQTLISTLHKAPRGRYGFVYKVVLQNKGAREITTVDWDYVFFDVNTQAEIGRRQFASEQKIAPGRTKELSFFIPNPPTRSISVQSLNKHERDGLGERIELIRIQYSDGASWPQT
jgi:hypothetical protein